ncbi:MAG: DUF423 domain-containing protein [Saprospiraceae bacterium]|nr:DUF423 domain-containing protein [Saprospiraceae bacterium]
MDTRKMLMLAALSGMFSVVLGAFGAHILKKLLSEYELQIFETGVRYQFYHTFALAIAGVFCRYVGHKWTGVAGWLFLAGTAFFSGSLYLLALIEHIGMAESKAVLGPITPIGGVLLIGGWLALFRAAFDYKKPSHGHSRSSSQK